MDETAGEGEDLKSLQNSSSGGDVGIRYKKKSLAPWRFQEGFLRSSSKGLLNLNKEDSRKLEEEKEKYSGKGSCNSLEEKEKASKFIEEKEKYSEKESYNSLEEKEKGSGEKENRKALDNLKNGGDAKVMGKRHKQLAPWRFQIGYVRSASKTLDWRKKVLDKSSEESFRFGGEESVESVKSMNHGPQESSEEPLKSVEMVSDSTKKESAPKMYPSGIRNSADWYPITTFKKDATNGSKKDTNRTEEIVQKGVAVIQTTNGKDVKGIEILTKKRKLEGPHQVNKLMETNEKESSWHIEQDGSSHVYQAAWQSNMAINDLLENIAARCKVMETLHQFRTIFRKVFEEEESKSKEADQGVRADLTAFKLFREKYGLGDGRKYLGSVPGVEVGDEFHLRVELCIVGLHRQHQAGIDFVNQGKTNLAISIVSSGRYSDVKDKSDVLIYSGSGIPHKDQTLDRGNLALKNSMETKTPVRVIYGFVCYQSSDSPEARAKQKKVPIYIYDGLYLVERYWRTKGSGGHYVFMFQLRRMAGQPKLEIAEIMKSKSSQPGFNLYIGDISQGKEKLPISAVNAIDTEYPMPFKYIANLIYPFRHHPPPPSGCDCIDGCSDSDKCACAVKNGGEIPFNHNGAIIEAKPLVYECGPSCKCLPSCHNRVSQHGLKFPLQIFKTEARGWGLRSLKKIPSGSFVCEYVGEILEDEEAQKRRNDEYLFAIGNNYYDKSLWEGLSTSIPALQKGASCETDEVGFTIDASAFGNVGRFINHSCMPNLYAQNLLYDHDDKSMPHIMFFASEDIQPLQELTYDYNYTIDQVHDSDGNIKRKNCCCGSIECTGRLY
ncbi:histone-lysine N-methyltransferase, H3 lysine-9 specific SUVH6-like isoform X1 [Phoenix dactylifera]|uniref:Histone-lysine N-methyltransferase, H3 lysine-9 specific SUVH6-like isoform X1 n=1 Tax=Phoenix dactylifera TaxID=42345 RepID=A0A8B7MUL9_PHODC|nr:histone-lysine N-methyltransferase, H3 lysine-9 specific SUVH6-like isoform X1 [Phoenix dactylifera]XP_017699206.2 histone-lysine N-methyltransferase, H3 lysine-9 specific SUVH6-like isoform X1 [Phoenix dactylifera]